MILNEPQIHITEHYMQNLVIESDGNVVSATWATIPISFHKESTNIIFKKFRSIIRKAKQVATTI
jgi:hypothetical protein